MVFVEHSFIMGLDDDVEYVLHNVKIRSNCLFQITNIASCQVDKYHIDFIPVNRVTLTNTIYNNVLSCNISKIKSNISHLFCGYLKLEMGVKWCVVFTPCYQKGYIEFIAISSNQNLLGIKLLARKIFKCLYSPKFGKISDT